MAASYKTQVTTAIADSTGLCMFGRSVTDTNLELIANAINDAHGAEIDADFILNIEGGVYRETSIGFSFRLPECSVCHRDLRTCSHVPGRTYEGEACHYVMREVLEVIEGSVVPSGSQGTSFVSASRGMPVGEALEAARRAYHAPMTLRSDRLWSAE